MGGKVDMKLPFEKINKKKKGNPSVLQQMTSCYHSYGFLYQKRIVLSCALTGKHVQTKIENAIYLHTVQCQYTEMQLHVLQYSSENTKFFSFYKLLGLRGLLKIFFWSLSSPSWVFQFILLLMVWNWVLLGLGTWSLLPGAQRRRKKPLMQIRKKGRKQQLLTWLFCDQNSLKWTLIQWVFWRKVANK